MSRGATVWFTGLSGAGKTTLAIELRDRLVAQGRRAVLLDGDIIRAGLNSDLGMTLEDRDENVRRISEVAVLFSSEGYVAIVAAISPRAHSRLRARETLERLGHEFIEVYVSTPVEVCRARDVKGLYRRADGGEISNFTGLDSPYEVPEAPDLVVEGVGATVSESVDNLLAHLKLRIPVDSADR